MAKAEPQHIIGARETWPVAQKGKLVNVRLSERVYVRMTEDEARRLGHIVDEPEEKARPAAQNKARKRSPNKAAEPAEAEED